MRPGGVRSLDEYIMKFRIVPKNRYRPVLVWACAILISLLMGFGWRWVPTLFHGVPEGADSQKASLEKRATTTRGGMPEQPRRLPLPATSSPSHLSSSSASAPDIPKGKSHPERPSTSTKPEPEKEKPEPTAEKNAYYISPSGSDGGAGTAQAPWKTFAKAFSEMPAGATLVLMDGTYSIAAGTGVISYEGANSAQPKSGGAGGNPTAIKAEHAGKAVIDSGSGEALFLGRSSRKDSYIMIDGLHFEGGGRLYNTSYVTIKNSSFHSARQSGGSVLAVGTNDGEWGNGHNLVEDVWIWGKERLIAANYRADNNVWRRVVVRGDGCNSAHCDGSGNPTVGITVYDSSGVSLQNVLVVDRVLGGGMPGCDFCTAQHTGSGHFLGPVEWRGTISLNSEDTAYDIDGDYSNDNTVSFENSIAWDAARAGFFLSTPRWSADKMRNVKLVNLTAGRTGTGDAFRIGPEMAGSGTAYNLLSYDAGRFGISLPFAFSYANVFKPADKSYGQAKCAAGCLALNPMGGPNPALKYLIRIEPDSPLKGTGFGGGDYGANVIRRYGSAGSRFGEAGYNALTDVPLWPWPNEARISQDMCIETGETRGFCGAQSLTKYVWEYLGNPMPVDIARQGGGS